MLDVPVLSLLYIPDTLLEHLANRHFTFVAQRYHFIVRFIHILSSSAFFGAVGLLDVSLMDLKGSIPLKAFASHILPWLYGTFWVAFLSGIFLFFYDPVHVGSHAYFMPKMLFMVAGMLNAVIYNRFFVSKLIASDTIPRSSKLAGAASLVFWLGVMVCSCLNAESVPKVILR